MKYIAFKDTKQFQTVAILKGVLEQTPQGCKLGEMRKRNRIYRALDTLEPGATGMALEDADHELLTIIINDYPFGRSHPELEAILDAAIEAAPQKPGIAEARPNGAHP